MSMREPEIGESILCGVCMGPVDTITKQNIESYRDNERCYSNTHHCFLGYCGCED